MTVFLEVFIRFSMIGCVLILCASILQHGWRERILQYALLLNLSIICALLIVGTESFALRGTAATPMTVISDLLYAFTWRFGMALFEEDFRLGWREWCFFSLYVTLPVLARLHFCGVIVIDQYPLGLMWLSYNVMTVSMMIHLIYRAIAGRKQDLVESRRRDRVRFSVMMAALLILVIVVNVLGESNTFDIRYVLLPAFPVIVWMNLWLTRLHPEALAFQPIDAYKPKPLRLNPHDAAAHSRLVELMEQETLYTEQGLTIRMLAEQVGIPEHQLRVLINQSMGYRNFSSFLNHYRIKAAMRQLAMPDKSRIPVLTIAMDAGYASITPFNSAFKAIAGMTPSAFRKRALEPAAEHEAIRIPEDPLDIKKSV